MISNSDIQQGAVTQTKLSKNLRLPLNNIKAGAEGQVLVGQTNGDLAYKDVSGAIGIDADGVTTMATTTDSIPEGNTNLYYTDARVDARIKAVSQIGHCLCGCINAGVQQLGHLYLL